MKYLALLLVLLVVALPSSAAGVDPKPPKPLLEAKIVPLRTQIARLNKRVTALEAKSVKQGSVIGDLQKNLAALRTIVCLQLPSAC